MKILAIETSCDETAAAVIEDGIKILSNVLASSMKIHERTGGIIPEVAAREQVKCIIPVINETLLQTTNNKLQTTKKCKKLLSVICYLLSEIDAIAVTVGPGLNGSLLVGIETAKTIAYLTNKPIIPVNHIFAHIYANWLSPQPPTTNHLPRRQAGQLPTFPAIALVVSGGHTELFLLKNHENMKWLGGTRDDAAGEAFDKTARLLELGYPGGPAIAASAAKLPTTNYQLPTNIKLPRPMINSKDFDFSFAGLKTAVLREVNRLKSLKKLNNEVISQLAYEIQESITDVLVKKTLTAALKYKVKSILLGGGVAANKRLTEKFKLEIENLKLKINLHIPPPSFCTDNAAYIGSFAYFHNHPKPWKEISSHPDLTVEV